MTRKTPLPLLLPLTLLLALAACKPAQEPTPASSQPPAQAPTPTTPAPVDETPAERTTAEFPTLKMKARDLDQVSLADLYECTQLRIPVAEQHLPYRDDSLGRAALAALDDLRLPLRERLKRKVSDIYTDSGDMP